MILLTNKPHNQTSCHMDYKHDITVISSLWYEWSYVHTHIKFCINKSYFPCNISHQVTSQCVTPSLLPPVCKQTLQISWNFLSKTKCSNIYIFVYVFGNVIIENWEKVYDRFTITDKFMFVCLFKIGLRLQANLPSYILQLPSYILTIYQ